MDELLHDVASYAADFLAGLEDRPVDAAASPEELRALLDTPVPEEPSDPRKVIAELIAGMEPGVVATAGPRYFGFVVGGALPAALAADWLTSAWDQNAGLYLAGPSAATVEDVAGRWVAELLGLPAGVSYAFTTGAQMANFSGLATARHAVLEQVGWNVERDGLAGAPRVRVVAGAARHVTVDRALRFLGLGTGSVDVVDVDDQGRMKLDALAAALSDVDGPAIVCAQAGEVNTGGFDALGTVCDLAHDVGAWVHVDGAFGLWAAAAPARRHLVDGVERADSWATDAHKWLNVPYDCGIALCAHPDVHRAALGSTAAYLLRTGGRDGLDWTPEASRRARGVTVYAALRSLGRSGVAEVVERCCALAVRMAERLDGEQGITVLNDVVLNQVLVRFDGGDEVTRETIRRVQESGVCWMGGTSWRGAAAMRISFSNWRTSEADVDLAGDAIVAAHRGMA